MSAEGIILVEPGVHLRQGHYREKLSLWVEAFRTAGWNVSVVCLEAPERSFLAEVLLRPLPPWCRQVGRFLPNRIKIPWLVFCTFFLAFVYGKRSGHSVFGLTTSTLFPVAAARGLANARSIPFAQVMMYGNIFEGPGPSIRKAVERASLNSLLRDGAIIFPNTDRTRESVLSRLENIKFQDRVVTLYDPIYIPKKPIFPAKRLSEDILLVPGPDDERRSPLFHLANSGLSDPPRTLWIHAPGRKEEDILGSKRRDLKFVSDVHVSTEYKGVEAFADLFSSATWCVIAYAPFFFQGSGLLAQAIAGGTPVLCSSFPHAEELFAKFGRLGELFVYGDLDNFRHAWSRLRNWTPGQWQEFQEASLRFADAVNAEHITRKAIECFKESRI
jgi:hypothetical protein